MYDNGYGGEEYSAPQNENQGQINNQICKIHGKDKVIDFRDGLIYAKYEDFANIHGVGGKKHAPNSTIQVVLCDYSNGKGPNSVTVRYRLEVEDIEILHEAAKKAYFNDLSGSLLTACLRILERLRSWFYIMPFPDGSRPIAESEIVEIGQMLRTAVDQPSFVYSYEKSNPYEKASDGMAPVQRINIKYVPLTSSGEESRYPWIVSIENFQAPLVELDNGASYHKSSKAKDLRSANIMLSRVDFLRSMISVSRYIKHWESLYRDTLRKALNEYKEQTRIWKETQRRLEEEEQKLKEEKARLAQEQKRFAAARENQLNNPPVLPASPAPNAVPGQMPYYAQNQYGGFTNAVQ